MDPRREQMGRRARRARVDRRVCPRGRPTGLGDPRGDRRVARVARVADRAAAGCLAGADPGRSGAARVEPVRGVRPGLPAVLRRGGGDLHDRPADRAPARGVAAPGERAARRRRLARLRPRYGPDRVARVRLRGAPRRSRERARRAGDAGAARAGVRDRGPGCRRTRQRRRPRLAERVDGRLHRSLCAVDRVAPVRRRPDLAGGRSSSLLRGRRLCFLGWRTSSRPRT